MEDSVLLHLIHSVNLNILFDIEETLKVIRTSSDLSEGRKILINQLYVEAGNNNRHIISLIQRPPAETYLVNAIEATASSYRQYLTIRHTLGVEELTQEQYIEELDLLWKNTYLKVKTNLTEIGNSTPNFLIDTILAALTNIDKLKYPLCVYPTADFYWK
jgi:hypothetical protein